MSIALIVFAALIIVEAALIRELRKEVEHLDALSRKHLDDYLRLKQHVMNEAQDRYEQRSNAARKGWETKRKRNS